MGALLGRSYKQSYTHRAYWDQPQSGTLTYVALGDSAGLGVGLHDPSRSYVALLAQRLQSTTGSHVCVVNLSVSGATAEDLLRDQIPNMPDPSGNMAVTCVIGGNDVARLRFDAQAFAQTMEMIAARLPVGAVMGLVPRFGHWPYDKRVQLVNEAIRDAAATRAHRVADIYTPSVRLSMAQYMKTLARDFFHPNESGHVMWADAVWDQLAP